MAVQIPTDRHAALVKQTQRWVAQTFYGTLLKQVRESPYKDTMFSGGRGGEAFGSMLDQQLSDRMAKSAGSKLVNSIVSRIEASHGRFSSVKGKAASNVNVKA